MASSRRVVINGFAIETAPSFPELYDVLGQPSRIDSGEIPAPYGHRNNQTHIYDEAGLTFNEHHHTRRAQAICCWYETADSPFRFTPRQPFTGQLMFENVDMPRGGRPDEYLAVSPFEVVPGFGGIWSYKFSGFDVRVESRGAKLKSGRRNKVRQVAEIWVSWPHDDWGKPVEA